MNAPIKTPSATARVAYLLAILCFGVILWTNHEIIALFVCLGAGVVLGLVVRRNAKNRKARSGLE